MLSALEPTTEMTASIFSFSDPLKKLIGPVHLLDHVLCVDGADVEGVALGRGTQDAAGGAGEVLHYLAGVSVISPPSG